MVDNKLVKKVLKYLQEYYPDSITNKEVRESLGIKKEEYRKIVTFCHRNGMGYLEFNQSDSWVNDDNKVSISAKGIEFLRTEKNANIQNFHSRVMLLATIVIALSTIANLWVYSLVSRADIDLTKSLVEKKPDFTISIPNTTGLLLPNPHLCKDASDTFEGNLTLINTGHRPIVLSSFGNVFEECSDKKVQIGGIDSNFKVLELEKPLHLSYRYLPTSLFVGKDCKIIFSIASEDGEVEKSKVIENVEIKICRDER